MFRSGGFVAKRLFAAIFVISVILNPLAAFAGSGSIKSWGNIAFDSSSLMGQLTSVSAGGRHSLGLKADGSIVGWGANDYGQVTVPAGNDFIAVATGENHSLALKSDGSIVGWGNNYHYDSQGNKKWYGQATPPAGNNFIAIAAGGYHSLAIKSDGSIVGWGNNAYGQALPPAGNNFIAIAAGTHHSIALKTDGSVVGWGYKQVGRPSGNNFIAISAGGNHCLALKSNGFIVGWGGNFWDPVTPPAENGFIAIAAGGGYYDDDYSIALKADGTIVGWGSNYYNADNGGTKWGGQTITPSGNNFTAIAAGGGHCLALKTDGKFVGWGRDDYAQSKPPIGNDFIEISASASYWSRHCLALRFDGSIAGWGDNFNGQATPPAGNNFIAVSAGEGHSLALKSDGSIVGWGSQAKLPKGNDFIAVSAGFNRSPSLALKSDGSIIGWGSQIKPPKENDFIAIAAGNGVSYGLKSDGSIVGWTDWSYWQIPDDGNNFIAIAEGSYYLLAIKSDGTLFGYGTLPEGNDFVAISGGFPSVALRSDGSIAVWGWNAGTSPAGNNYIAVAAGYEYSLSIESDCPLISPPRGISASDGTYADHIQISWNPVSNAVGYEVWRNTSNTWFSAVKLGDYTTPFDDYDVIEGTTYYYWIKAKNDCGTSRMSVSEPGFAYLAPTNEKFGSFEAQQGVILTLKDCKNNDVTFVLTGLGYGVVNSYDDQTDCYDCTFPGIELYNTNEKSQLTIITEEQGENRIGDITVNGSLKGISAKTVDLKGDITVTGSLGMITLDDIIDGRTITIGPTINPKAGTLMKFDEVSDLTIDSQTPVKILTASRWIGGTIDVPSAGSISITGDKKRQIPIWGNLDVMINSDGVINSVKAAGTLSGEWNCAAIKNISASDVVEASIILSQPPDPKISALGKLTAKGWIDSSQILSQGNIGTISAGGIANSSCFAGIISTSDLDMDGVFDLPDPAIHINYDNPAIIKGLQIKGIKWHGECFGNSNIAAAQILNASLNYPGIDNDGIPFGLSAGFIKSLKIKDAQGTVSYKNLDTSKDNLEFGDAEILLY